MSYRNPQETGRPINVKDEGLTIATNVESFDYIGSGVEATAAGADVDVNINGTSTNEIWGETPSGTIDGVNTDFTLAHVPVLLRGIYRGGSRQSETDDYTITGDTITFIYPPQVGENIRVDYVY